MTVESTTLQCNHQRVLLNSTNVLLGHSLLSHPEGVSSKRGPPTPDEPAAKRPRLTRPNGDAGDGDADCFIKSNIHRHTIFSLLQTSCRRPPSSSPRITLPSRLILQSFVSSHRSDVFRCASLVDHTFVTPPYACAYSYGAKGCGAPLLAVATEEGSVSVFDTSRRREWDFEPQRMTFQPHENGIFDVKWSLDDSMLATASGDKSTRICSVETQNVLQTLQTHTGSVKCIAWDPSHRDILSTGSRDGKICVWDIRMASGAGFTEGTSVLQPVITVHDAHGQGKSISGRRKLNPLPRSVTSILYSDTRTDALISSGSFDGILNLWDLRLSVSDDPKQQMRSPWVSSPDDATIMNGSCRPRGISSLCAGSGPTSGLLFALGADSRLYTYSSPSLMPLEAKTHPNLRTSFYVRLASSPCGRWLAIGCSGKNGSSFLFDISNAARMSALSFSKQSLAAAVELRGQTGEVGAVDWAQEVLATCADDGTVRVWRPNYDIYQKCLSDPDAERWNWCWSQDIYPYER